MAKHRKWCGFTPSDSARRQYFGFDAVKITLGPKGRNAVIEKKFGSPADVKDSNRCKKMMIICIRSIPGRTV